MDIVTPGVYTHYKGGKYRVLLVAKDSTNARDGEAVVLYVSLTNGNIFCRDLKEFVEPVEWPDGSMYGRFVLEA